MAPLVVDWNHYRAPIEAEASRLTGLNVRVNGAIDARFCRRRSSRCAMSTSAQRGSRRNCAPARSSSNCRSARSFAARCRPSEAHLIGPQISLALDRSGAIELPALSPSFHPQALSISHFSVDDGRVTLTDAASGSRLVLQKLWFNGDIASFAGPFNGQGAAVFGDELYGYRISGSAAERGGIKIRLGIDPSNIPLTTSSTARSLSRTAFRNSTARWHWRGRSAPRWRTASGW